MRSNTLSTHITVFLLLGLLQSCGGGSDSVINTIENPTEPPQDGIRGSVSSRISGGTLSVQDATGANIVLSSGRTTDAAGNYHLIFSEFAIEDGITAPLVVTLDGTDATAICDFDGPSDNDCLSSDGTFVPFGTIYTLPAGFQLRGIVATFPSEDTVGERTVVVQLSAVSDLATHYATATGTLNSSGVELALQQAVGLAEFMTGLSSAGTPLNEIEIVDLNVATQKQTSGLAIALFGASLHNQVDLQTPTINSYGQVLSRLASNVITDSNSEQLNVMAKFAALTINSYLPTASAFQLSLPTPSPILSGALAAQTTAAALLDLANTNIITIALPTDPNSNDPLAATKTFISRLSEVMGSTLIISQTAAFGGTATGAALVYSNQLNLITTLASRELRQAVLQLDVALSDALANDDIALNGTNVSGALSFDGNIVNMTNTTSTTSNIQTGISVNVSIPSGTRNNPNGAGKFDATEITISISQIQNDLTKQLSFNGTLSLNMEVLAGLTDASSLDYIGSFTTDTGQQFSGEISMSSLGPVSESIASATYQGAFSFNDASNLSLLGELSNQISMYTVTSGTSTIMVDLQTNTVTDMTSQLNLTLNGNNEVTGGTITVGDISPAKIEEDGVVFYSDGSLAVLPVPII